MMNQLHAQTLVNLRGAMKTLGIFQRMNILLSSDCMGVAHRVTHL